jgi:hypothetical protein
MQAEIPKPEGLRQRRFPFADRALTIMVFVIVVDVFLFSPMADMLGGTRHWAELVFTVVLVLGALVIWGNLWITDLFVATGIASIAIRVGLVGTEGEALEYVATLCSCANFLILGVLLARRVFAPGRVNVHRVQGAVAVYLLAGLVFGQIFQLIALASPGAFLMLGHPASYEQITPHLNYYSFVALTTLGFGDITPVHPLAKSFTLLAAVFGTLYPAILIGRLVSQQIMHSDR